MLASLESVQFVTNLLFGRLLLKAKITETMLAGTMLTVIGTVLVRLFVIVFALLCYGLHLTK